MNSITITIKNTGAAFDDNAPGEFARILREIAARLESAGIPPVPRDSCGNKCGSVTVEG